MIDERIVPSFWLSEFLESDTATRLGLDNTPKPSDLANIRNLLAPGMQRIREALGAPVHITSGYRSPEVNRAVGSTNPNSQHTQGLAADFKSPQYGTPLVIVRFLVARGLRDLRIDQLIQEGRWVHVSFSPTPRNQVLTAHFAASGTTYSPGVA